MLRVSLLGNLGAADAAALHQPDVQRLVSTIRRRPEVAARRVTSVNARPAMEAYRRLMLVDGR